MEGINNNKEIKDKENKYERESIDREDNEVCGTQYGDRKGSYGEKTSDICSEEEGIQETSQT